MMRIPGLSKNFQNNTYKKWSPLEILLVELDYIIIERKKTKSFGNLDMKNFFCYASGYGCVEEGSGGYKKFTELTRFHIILIST